jgi:chromosome partitioning protein
MFKIAFCNEKGGVGKTTSALTVSAGLAMKGARVLHIDADPQANSTSQLQVKESGGLYRLLVEDSDWKQVLVKPDPSAWAESATVSGELLLLPSHISARGLAAALEADALYLRDCLNDLDGRIDVVVFDTSPTPSLLHSFIYMACDMVVLPSLMEQMSLEGLVKSKKHIEQQGDARMRAGLPPIRIAGIQPMLYRSINPHKHSRGLVEQTMPGMVWDSIRDLSVWKSASKARKSIFAYSPKHDAAAEAWALVNRVIAVFDEAVVYAS